MQHGLPPTCTIQALIAYMLHNAGSSEAKAQNDPITDRYDPLRALAGAGTLGTSPAVILSDAQPFPMTGHVQVWWATTTSSPDPCQSIRDQLSNLSQTDFSSRAAFETAFSQLETQLRECETNAKN